MRGFERVLGALLLAASAITPGCGGGGGTGPSDGGSQPVTPAATVQATGNGVIRLHPSQDLRYQIALEMPLRITESTGGTADWTFARYSVIRSGNEVERNEIGSDVLGRNGLTRITPRSTGTPTLVFRQNASDFDSLAITLGFTDIKDGRQFTVDVPFGTFGGIDISIIPALSPSDQPRP